MARSKTAGNYQRVAGGQKAKAKPTTNWCGRCCGIVVVFVCVGVILSMGGAGNGGTGKNGESADDFRSGQAHHSSTAVEKPHHDDPSSSGSSGGSSTTAGDYADAAYEHEQLEHEVDAEVSEATDYLENAEATELEREEEKLDQAVQGWGAKIRVGLGQLFGKKVSTEEVEEIAAEVEAQLKAEVDEELETRAEEIRDEEVEAIDAAAEFEVEDAESEMGPPPGSDSDIIGMGGDLGEEVKTGIDNAEAEIEAQLKKRAKEMEKAILEERLSKRLGKTVKLVIVEDEIQGVDELLAGLSLDGGNGGGGSGNSGSSSYGNNSGSSGYGGNSGGSSGYGGNSGGSSGYGGNSGGGSSSYGNGGSGGNSGYGGNSGGGSSYGSNSGGGGSSSYGGNSGGGGSSYGGSSNGGSGLRGSSGGRNGSNTQTTVVVETKKEDGDSGDDNW